MMGRLSQGSWAKGEKAKGVLRGKGEVIKKCTWAVTGWPWGRDVQHREARQ